MKQITAFSFGYWGWGTSTEQLVKAVDSVERSRGFKPPVFIDVRIQRVVRAKGFSGTAFEKLLGPKRHHWIKKLGNERIRSGEGPRIQITDPTAANDLLDHARAAAQDDHRIIFFCSCEWPKCAGKVACHRTRVSTLLLAAARRQAVSLEVVEWPGGMPTHMNLPVSPELFRSVKNGRMSIPVGNPKRISEYTGLAWGSTVTIHSGGESLHRILGPAKWEKGEWSLPILPRNHDPDVALKRYQRDAETERRLRGLIARRSDESL